MVLRCTLRVARAGGVAAFCADQTFWRLLAEGPVVCVFENHIEGHAIIEAYGEHGDGGCIELVGEI